MNEAGKASHCPYEAVIPSSFDRRLTTDNAPFRYSLRGVHTRVYEGIGMAGQLVEGTVAVVFPGQGSQFVGMATKLAAASPAAKAVVEQADEILGFPLSDLMASGPAETLEDTINAQPAILTASIAALEAIRERGGSKALSPVVGAGHSLGEFSALVANGALDFPTALRLVRERGRLMKEAGDIAPGGMAAVLGLDDETLAEVCKEASSEGVIVIANANCPGQTVISGQIAALERAMTLAKERGAKRALRLGVSIAAHSELMAAANAEFGKAIAASPISEPAYPILSNSTAEPLSTAAEIRAELIGHMEGPVLWTQTVQAMVAGGVTAVVEIGPGAVLAGLIKRIDRELPVKGIGDLGLDLPVDN
jgi:[acyl-carrier-protein] S-malonyltransferase